MDLDHPLGSQFGGVAGAYERGRPGYAPAVVGALMAELGLSPGDKVVDLAAGTGKLTRALLAGGLDVTGVEPSEGMREVLAEIVGADRAVDGLGEDMPIGDFSQRAVTIADAFHWMDGPRTLAEIARVLEPGGGLALLATIPDWTGATWAHDLGSLMAEARPDHPYFDGPSWAEIVAGAGGWTDLREIRITTGRPSNPDGIADYLLSMSWVASMTDAERDAMVAKAEELVREGETPDELPIHFRLGLTQRI